MKEIIKEVKMYVVGDKEFLSEKEASEYKKQIEEELTHTFFRITHEPDLTEGRGYYKTTIIAVPENFAEHATALNYCVEQFGEPLAFVQGVSPMPNWIIKSYNFKTMEDLLNFKDSNIYEGVGDYLTKKIKQIIYLDNMGNVI
ncbi:MAG TPA: hypothetical protein GXZ90_00330 [Clostridiales bacterium]|nr:hypothetical protein [Clostridiales bacterium]